MVSYTSNSGGEMKSISDKRRKLLAEETLIVQQLLERYEGKCMICGGLPDFRGLQKNHTKDRKLFILSCAPCHSPKGKHEYLDYWIKEGKVLMVKELKGGSDVTNH